VTIRLFIVTVQCCKNCPIITVTKA